MKLSFSIGILSMRSPATLFQTLTSYRDQGLLSLTDDVAIYFQQISDTDLAIAEEFGITKVYGDERNIGIGKAFTLLTEQAKYEYVLLLENDWVLTQEPVVVFGVLSDCCKALDGGKFDFIRLRNSKEPGSPLYTLRFQNRELDCEQHMLDAQHWLGEDLAVKYSGIIKLHRGENSNFVYTNSYYGSHTNNPAIFKKQFYLEHVSPFAGQNVDLEGKIIPYWRSQNFKVAHNIPSLFTHNRIDN